MAAPWRIYARDYLAGLIETGSASVAGADGSGTSPTYAADGDPTSVWLPGTGSNRDLNINLGSSRSIQAIGLANQTIQGATITLYRGATFGSTTTTVYGPTAIPATADRVYLIDFTEVASQFWKLRIGTGSASYQVGSVAMLGGETDASGPHCFELLNAGAPAWPIGSGAQSGVVRIPSAGGTPVTQVVEGVRERLRLQLQLLDASEGATWDDMLASYRALNGWPQGIWVTDDRFDDTNHRGRAYHGELVGDLEGQLTSAGPRANATIDLLCFSRGIA